MEEMVSQLSTMVEDLKIERRYALSTLAGRRIREAAEAVEDARVLVCAAVNVGESDARRRMDDTLLPLGTLRADAVMATVEAEAIRAEDAVDVDYTVDYDYRRL